MKKYLLIIAFVFSFINVYSQDDLLNELEKQEVPKREFAYATFKGTKVINGQSVEISDKGNLTFMIQHRFGEVNNGGYDLFGIDQASMRMGFEYGISDNFAAGWGRSTYNKTFDLYGKYKLLRQSTGAKEVPVTMTFYTGLAYNTLKRTTLKEVMTPAHRLSYHSQLIVGRKFNKSLSIQIAPTYIHRNLTATAQDPNDLFAVGGGFRLKLNKRISLNGEYYYLLNSESSYEKFNALAFGVDIETGGHVFQLQFTNAVGMTENYFIGETTSSWKDIGIRFGFNLARVFMIAG